MNLNDRTLLGQLLIGIVTSVLATVAYHQVIKKSNMEFIKSNWKMGFGLLAVIAIGGFAAFYLFDKWSERQAAKAAAAQDAVPVTTEQLTDAGYQR